MLKLSIIALLLFLTVSLAAEIPSNKRIQKIMDTHPEVIYDMVKKLYVVEKAIPRITVPSQRMFFTLEGDLIVEYEGEGSIEIGEGTYNLAYSFKLHPQVVLGFMKLTSEIHPVWYVLGGVVIFGSGVITGFFIGK